jgi:glycosyltransferase involved in cell wall biosynthesis
MVQELGLKRVMFVDFVQQPELPGVYALGDAFVFATRGDPYGLVVDEAMAAGLPVISTTHAGEIGARVIQDETGLLIPPDNVSALETAMLSMLDDRKRAMEMGASANHRFADRSVDSWAAQIEKFLDLML